MSFTAFSAGHVWCAANGVTPRRRKRLIRRLYLRSVLVNPTGQLQICRDPSDDPLIEAAILGRAGYLVSEDADLYDDPDIVSLLQSYGIQVVRLPGFLLTLAQHVP